MIIKRNKKLIQRILQNGNTIKIERFDEENLPLILPKAGFKDVKLREFDPTLDLQQRIYESIYAEGKK